MNGSSLSGAKGFSFTLRFVSLFAAAHIVLVFLQSNFVPLSGGWNLVWLGLELLLGVGAFVLSVGCWVYAQRHKTDSQTAFRSLFASIISPGFWFLLLWVLWAYIACFLAVREGRTSFYHNVRYLFYQTADLLVLFPLGVYYGKQEKTRFLCALYDVTLALFTLQLLYGFSRFFSGEAQFTAFFGRRFDYSMLRPVIGVNSNHTGAYAAFFLVAGLWRFRLLSRPTGKILLALAGAICFAAFAMVESRGAIIGMAIAVSYMAGVGCWRRRKQKSIISALISVICALLAAGAFLLVFYGTRSVLLQGQNAILGHIRAATVSSAPAVSDSASTPNIAPAPGASGDQEIRGIVGKGASTLGGRKKIWLTVIRGVQKDLHILLHGSSMASTSDWVATVFGKAFRTHNQFLEVLVAQGLPALILFLVWLVWLAHKSLRLSFDPQNKIHWMLPLPLLQLIAHNMVEMMIVARPHVICGLFYLIAGYVAGFAPTGRK